MQSQAKTVAAYISVAPADRRSALTTLRALIRKIAPTVKETIMHGMPAYVLGEGLCAFASQKHYMALYICDGTIEKYRPRLGKLNCGKGCIRFRKIEDLPLDVITDLLREVTNLQSDN